MTQPTRSAAPRLREPEPRATRASPAWATAPRAARLRLLWIAAVAPALLSLGLVAWARTRPGFDPYGWLVWGRQTLSLSLDTNAAPSWKPLPYLFTVPYALFGNGQLWLWMFTAVAISLAGVVFAARIAYRLVGRDAERSYAAPAAAVFAGLGVLAIQDYSHYVLSYQSDPVIVALCLGAVDCQLSRRPRWALALWLLASLGRPEVWPFLGLFCLWAWRALPAMRALVVAALLLLVGLWFGIPAVTARSPFVAGTNALGSVRAPHGNKVVDTMSRFVHLQPVLLEVVALVGVALAALRRDRVTLAVAGGAVLWVLVEIAFALHGWPALPRYMFEAAAALAVLAAVAVGRLLGDPLGPARWAGLARWTGLALVVAICAGLVPAAVSRVRDERSDLSAQRLRTTEINRLAPAISRAGGAALIRGCGEPLTLLEYQTILAWHLRINVARIGWKFPRAIRSGRPIVLFTPRGNGWRIRARHQGVAACRRVAA
ncbi:MAG: hypothetical protein JO153_03250 [Solirubrobacterales bacterium]|nr:hypothetical protein [Solirubrobacterales bacterium]